MVCLVLMACGTTPSTAGSRAGSPSSTTSAGSAATKASVSPLSSVSPPPSSSPLRSPVVVVTPSPSSPVASASATPSPMSGTSISDHLAVFDFEGPFSPWYVGLLSTAGKIVATAPYRARSRGGITFPFTSTSDSTLYFLDGDSQVRALSASGSVVNVRTVPGSAAVVAVFAVSPDDVSIAVSLIDYSISPPQEHLYVEDLHGGNHVDLPSPLTGYVMPVGWHDGDLVLRLVPGADPTAGADSYQVVDPHSGTVVATVCGGSEGSPIDIAGPGGTMCGVVPQGTVVSDWAGRIRPLAGETDCVDIAPNAQVVACVDSNNPARNSYHLLFDDGRTAALPGTPDGWIDDAWLVMRIPYQSTASGGIDHAVYNVLTGTQIPFSMGGEIHLGRLPGAF
jgi:hypothetical protein